MRKLKGNRRKPWIAELTIGWVEGCQKRKIIGYFETKADGELAIAKEMLMPTSDDYNVTLSVLFEHWKETPAYTSLSKQTQQGYDAAYKYYMDGYHNKKFKDLKTPHFQKMVDKAMLMGKSRSTMEKVKALSGILSNYALSQDIINKAYSQHVKLPKETKKNIQTFSDLDIDKLFKNDTLPLADTILILIYTGMRIEELLSLTKFNVDIDQMLITGGVKTDAGKDRIIPIHSKIQKYVRARYESASNYLIEWDKPIGNEKKGTLKIVKSRYRVEYYRDVYYETLDKLGISRDLTPHKARHTFFTRLTAVSTDRKAIALVGGHTDPNFTDKTYVQPDVERLKTTIEKLK